MTTEQTPDLAVYVDRIIQELAELDVRKAALTLQLTGVRDKLKGFRTRKAKTTNGSSRKARKPRPRTAPPQGHVHGISDEQLEAQRLLAERP